MAKKIKGHCVVFWVAMSLFLFTGCASYQSQISSAYADLQSRRAASAIEKLKQKAEIESDDQLLYLLELAIAYHEVGEFKESNKVLLQAERIADIQDYHSLSKITGSILLSESVKQYKGEDFEKLMINVYLAINYAALGEIDEALVEVRKLNIKLQKYRLEAKRDYEQNTLARYLSAALYENEKNWDSAIIDYEEVYKRLPNFKFLGEDLLYASKKSGRSESFAKYQKVFSGLKIPKERLETKKHGELFVIYQQGQGPQKLPHPDFPRVPKLYPRPSRGQLATIEVFKDKLLVQSQQTELIWNLQDVAIQNLDQLYADYIASRIAGLVAKAVVADQVRQKNRLLGDLAWIGLNILDQADLRQWASLPQTFQLGRILLPPGNYDIQIKALNQENKATGEESDLKNVKINPGQKTVLTWRSWN